MDMSGFKEINVIDTKPRIKSPKVTLRYDNYNKYNRYIKLNKESLRVLDLIDSKLSDRYINVLYNEEKELLLIKKATSENGIYINSEFSLSLHKEFNNILPLIISEDQLGYLNDIAHLSRRLIDYLSLSFKYNYSFDVEEVNHEEKYIIINLHNIKEHFNNALNEYKLLLENTINTYVYCDENLLNINKSKLLLSNIKTLDDVCNDDTMLKFIKANKALYNHSINGYTKYYYNLIEFIESSKKIKGGIVYE